MDLVGEDDLARRVEAELVFGVDEDQAARLGDLAPAREQAERQLAQPFATVHGSASPGR